MGDKDKSNETSGPEETPAEDEVPEQELGDLTLLREQLDEALREKDQFRTMAQRAQADLTNYRRRAAEEKDERARTAKSDLLLNLSVIAALMLDQYAGLGLADPLFGLAIAAWLAFGAWRGASEAVDALMDREWPESRRIAFVEAAASHPELSNLHDLRTRTSGNRVGPLNGARLVVESRVKNIAHADIATGETRVVDVEQEFEFHAVRNGRAGRYRRAVRPKGSLDES